MKLVNTKTGLPITLGDQVRTLRGAMARLVWADPPRKPQHSGYVYLLLTGRTSCVEFCPNVIGAEWVEN